MNASSTTTTKRRGFSPTNQFSSADDRGLKPFPTSCPPWCTVGSGETPAAFHRDYPPTDDRPQIREHEGPTFGTLRIDALERLDAPGELRFRAWAASTYAGRDLRQLTADALAAAQWIESRP